MRPRSVATPDQPTPGSPGDSRWRDTMYEDTADRLETALDGSDEEFTDALPAVLETASEEPTQFAAEHPDLVARLVDRMDDVDAAGFFSEHPESADQFQELLWSSVHVLVEYTPERKEEITEDITANFEADDSPMAGYLEIDSGERTARGGAGTREDADLSLYGPTDVLVGLITGSRDPVQGFMQGEYELEGDVGKGTRLSGVMGAVAEEAPEG